MWQGAGHKRGRAKKPAAADSKADAGAADEDLAAAEEEGEGGKASRGAKGQQRPKRAAADAEPEAAQPRRRMRMAPTMQDDAAVTGEVARCFAYIIDHRLNVKQD